MLYLTRTMNRVVLPWPAPVSSDLTEWHHVTQNNAFLPSTVHPNLWHSHGNYTCKTSTQIQTQFQSWGVIKNEVLKLDEIQSGATFLPFSSCHMLNLSSWIRVYNIKLQFGLAWEHPSNLPCVTVMSGSSSCQWFLCVITIAAYTWWERCFGFSVWGCL